MWVALRAGMQPFRSGTLSLVILLAGCAAEDDPVEVVRLEGLSVLTVGQEATMSAYFFGDSDTRPVPAIIEFWSTEPDGFVELKLAGGNHVTLVARSPGQTRVTARSPTLKGSILVTVNAAALVVLRATPDQLGEVE